MNLLSLLARLENRGLQVRAESGEVVIRPAGQLTPDERAFIVENRELILDTLNRRQGGYIKQVYVGRLYDANLALQEAHERKNLSGFDSRFCLDCAQQANRKAENGALLPPLTKGKSTKPDRGRDAAQMVEVGNNGTAAQRERMVA